jgi:hypothetical protein
MTFTTDGSGDATVNVGLSNIPRLLYAVEWKVGTASAGVDAVLSATNTESAVDQTLLTLTNANANAWYYPRTLEDDTSGTALTTTCHSLVNGDLKLVVSSGGASKTGAAIIYLAE